MPWKLPDAGWGAWGAPGERLRDSSRPYCDCDCFAPRDQLAATTALPDAVLDLGELLLDHPDDVARKRHVIELLGHLAAALVRPVEELDRRGGVLGLVLHLVHEDEGRPGNRPAVLARLVGEDLVEAVAPVGAGGRGLERFGAGGDELAVGVLHEHMRELVLLRIRVLDVADRTGYALQEGRHAFVALATEAADPFHRRAFTDLRLPLRAHLGEVVGEDEGGPGAVGTVHRRDGLVGQLEARIQVRDGGVVPLLDLAEVDVGEQRAGQLELAGLDAGNVHHGNHAADDRRELDEAVLGELLRLERHVARAEVDGLGLDLLDTGAGADRLVVDLGAGRLVVGFRPLGVERRGKRRACADDRRSGRRLAVRGDAAAEAATKAARLGTRDAKSKKFMAREPPGEKDAQANRVSLHCHDGNVTGPGAPWTSRRQQGGTIKYAAMAMVTRFLSPTRS